MRSRSSGAIGDPFETLPAIPHIFTHDTPGRAHVLRLSRRFASAGQYGGENGRKPVGLMLAEMLLGEPSPGRAEFVA